jgi:hypothetical protein
MHQCKVDELREALHDCLLTGAGWGGLRLRQLRAGFLQLRPGRLCLGSRSRSRLHGRRLGLCGHHNMMSIVKHAEQST